MISEDDRFWTSDSTANGALLLQPSIVLVHIANWLVRLACP